MSDDKLPEATTSRVMASANHINIVNDAADVLYDRIICEVNAQISKGKYEYEFPTRYTTYETMELVAPRLKALGYVVVFRRDEYQGMGNWIIYWGEPRRWSYTWETVL